MITSEVMKIEDDLKFIPMDIAINFSLSIGEAVSGVFSAGNF